MLTHRNLVANVAQTRPVQDVQSDDVVIAIMPFFHIYGMTVLLNAVLHARARLVMMPQLRPRGVPRHHRQPQGHGGLHRAAGCGGARQASVGRHLRPVDAASGPLRRGTARRGTRPRSRGPPRLPHGAGLRHDRTQPGQPRTPLDGGKRLVGSVGPFGAAGWTAANSASRLVDPTTATRSEFPQRVSARPGVVVQGAESWPVTSATRRRRRRRSTTTAGCAPETWPAWIPPAACTSSTGSRN